jgi:hypothetical protein
MYSTTGSEIYTMGSPLTNNLFTRSQTNYWVQQKVFVFLKRWHKHKLPRSFYKARIEKLVTCWEKVIASNGNYITD